MTNNTKTPEAYAAFVANRREAGRLIDIETCELHSREAYAYDMRGIRDVYGVLGIPERRPETSKLGIDYFVSSPTSDGWISEQHLPPEKREAILARIPRATHCDICCKPFAADAAVHYVTNEEEFCDGCTHTRTRALCERCRPTMESRVGYTHTATPFNPELEQATAPPPTERGYDDSRL
jgi:hypothetical protein